MKLICILLSALVCITTKLEANTNKGLVDLPEKVSKNELLPLKLLDNSNYSLRKHPFNINAFWLINDAIFDPDIESIDSYGLSISTPPRPLWQDFFNNFQRLENTEEYVNPPIRCLVNKYVVNGELKKMFILLDIKGDLFMISGRQDFIIENINIGICKSK